MTVSGYMSRSERTVPPERMPVGIHVGLGTVTAVVAVVAAAMMPGTAGAWRLVPVAAALTLVGVWTVDWVTAAAVAALAYLLVDGFLVNRYGVLTWNGTPDVYRLVVVSMSAAAGLACGVVRHWLRERRRFMLPREWVAVAPASVRGMPLLADKEDVPGV